MEKNLHVWEDPTPAAYGIWLKRGVSSHVGTELKYDYECSNCHEQAEGGYMQCGLKFCKYCGIKMREVTPPKHEPVEIEGVKQQDERCPICGAINPERFYTTKDYFHTFGCSDCIRETELEDWVTLKITGLEIGD